MVLIKSYIRGIEGCKTEAGAVRGSGRKEALGISS